MTRSSAFAAASAVALLAFASSAAQAGGTLIGASGAPNPSFTGQTVTLTATFTDGGCAATFTDQTNSVAMCTTGAVVGNTTQTCTYAFPTLGTRTVGATSGCGGSASYSHVVTTPVPTLAEWALWGFGGLLMMVGAGVLARRARRFGAASGDDRGAA